MNPGAMSFMKSSFPSAPPPASTHGGEAAVTGASSDLVSPGNEGQPTSEEFGSIVDDYAEEMLASGLEAENARLRTEDGALMSTKETSLAATSEKPARRKEAHDAGLFSGTWQLLLDLLETSGEPWISPGAASGQAEGGAATGLAFGFAGHEPHGGKAALAAGSMLHQMAPQHAIELHGASAINQVASAIVSASGGSNRLVMRLHPPNLGTVTVKITRAAGKVAVEVRTTDSRVQGMLARGVGELRDSLRMQGIAVDRFDVMNGENHGRKDGRDTKRRKATVTFQIEFDPPKGD